MSDSELIERLAAEVHTSWAHWMEWLFSQCEHGTIGNPGELVIPAEYVAHLRRQMETSYADLSEREKASDRNEVKRLLPIIMEWHEDW